MKIISVILSLIFFLSCNNQQPNQSKKSIFVSIVPQKYFVERIAGEKFKVNVMVMPGHNPATFEPTPKQMVELKNAHLYFKIGVPFEKAWIKKIAESNPEMKIVDTRQGIELREMDSFNALLKRMEQKNYNKMELDKKHYIIKDPHIWLSPELVKTQAETICDALVEFDENNKVIYRENLEEFKADLDQVHEEIKTTFEQLKNREFLVFHPAWGYFADEFGLKQIPVEIEGKTPTAKELSRIIDFAKNKNIKVIFVQSQFSTTEAEAIAEAIDGKIIQIDPLAEDYLNNLKHIVDVMVKEL